MQLDEFYDYKNQLIGDLLTNKKIVHLLNDTEEIRTNPEGLVYTQLFPFEFVPEINETAKTFICCDVDIFGVSNKTFLTPDLYIWVFTHKTLLKLPDGGVRIDRLCSEIAKTINGSRCYGLGELSLYSVQRFSPVQDYLGKVMIFEAKDFNRPSPSGKYAPSNRKCG